MKKLFTNPEVEVKTLSPANEVMGVFSSTDTNGAIDSSRFKVITDDKGVKEGQFTYWQAK